MRKKLEWQQILSITDFSFYQSKRKNVIEKNSNYLSHFDDIDCTIDSIINWFLLC
jgi:hypothetical protein